MFYFKQAKIRSFFSLNGRKAQKVSLESHKTKAEIEPDLLNLHDKFIKKVLRAFNNSKTGKIYESS